eukprot:2202666-Prymnesium_polylepis.1
MGGEDYALQLVDKLPLPALQDAMGQWELLARSFIRSHLTPQGRQSTSALSHPPLPHLYPSCYRPAPPPRPPADLLGIAVRIARPLAIGLFAFVLAPTQRLLRMDLCRLLSAASIGITGQGEFDVALEQSRLLRAAKDACPARCVGHFC